MMSELNIGEGEVTFFSAKRWDRRNRADLTQTDRADRPKYYIKSYQVQFRTTKFFLVTINRAHLREGLWGLQPLPFLARKVILPLIRPVD